MIKFALRKVGVVFRGSCSESEIGERGQAMTEYIFLVVLVALVLIPFVRILPEAIRGYVKPFYYCVSRPFP